MNDWLAHAFALVCGQNPEHLWAPGGLSLPCCQRCTGLYAGAAGALLLHWLCKPQPTAGWKWMHGMFLLQMVPFGFHWLPQGPVLRTVTGVLFAFGLVAYLWPLAATWVAHISHLLYSRTPFGRPSEPFSACGWVIRDTANGKSALRNRRAGYGFGVAATLVLVPGAAGWGGRFGFFALSGLAAVGALVLAILVVAHIGFGVAAILRRLLRSQRTAPA